MSKQKQCVTCNKSGGILICDGCQQTFCGKHVIEHRQDLANKLDGIMQEHDLLQHDLTRSSDEHVLLQKINKWEKESITKIQVAAEAARADLRLIIEKSKKQVAKTCHDIAVNLRSSREADDFSENDLNRWMQQLKELKLEITSPSSVQLTEDQRSVICLISIQNQDFSNKISTANKSNSFINEARSFLTKERFSRVIGDGKIAEDGLVGRCLDTSYWCSAYFLGERLYSEGRETIRFRIEQCAHPYKIFLGCMTPQKDHNGISFNSTYAVGWYGHDTYQHGLPNKDSYSFDNTIGEIATSNLLQLTFDCDKRQIELFHEQRNKTCVLGVNIEQTPFPWQLLLVLKNSNDCVRILP